MEGQFQVDRGYSATTPEGYEAVATVETKRRGWQFVDEFQRMVGEDSEPDVRFFVDSWRSGTAAALENFEQRRQREAEREWTEDAFCESDSFDTVSLVQERAYRAEISDAATAALNAGGSKTDRLPQSWYEPAAQTHEDASQEWERLTEECGDESGTMHPMTQQFACRLLGVTEVSSRRQIKAAYRRMVSRWHPDRLELGTEKMRRLANERMAAINEAYHLLIRESR